ncbi:hypothetical protein GCM10010403_46570 [Glycomyces rutgersensis]|uniref:Uncharacterized protein n=1 Tax=Glycomyces rutgersensis TaxID=58115 RepID=A0ABN3GAF4_9ACTN
MNPSLLPQFSLTFGSLAMGGLSKYIGVRALITAYTVAKPMVLERASTSDPLCARSPRTRQEETMRPRKR